MNKENILTNDVDYWKKKQGLFIDFTNEVKRYRTGKQVKGCALLRFHGSKSGNSLFNMISLFKAKEEFLMISIFNENTLAS